MESANFRLYLCQKCPRRVIFSISIAPLLPPPKEKHKHSARARGAPEPRLAGQRARHCGLRVRRICVCVNSYPDEGWLLPIFPNLNLRCSYHFYTKNAAPMCCFHSRIFLPLLEDPKEKGTSCSTTMASKSDGNNLTVQTTYQTATSSISTGTRPQRAVCTHAVFPFGVSVRMPSPRVSLDSNMIDISILIMIHIIVLNDIPKSSFVLA